MSPPISLNAGDPAPQFEAFTNRGDKVCLGELKGHPVILYFYPKDDTPGCTKEACGFRDHWKVLQKNGTVVLGVSPDGESAHTAFRKKYKLPFTLLSDPDKSMMKEYGAYGEKTLYGKKSMGVIRSTVWIGPDGKVRKHWKKVPDAAAHPEKVLDALEEGD